MLFLQPITTRGFRRQTFLLDELNPFIKRSARLLFQLGNPFLRHQDAGMHAVDRFALSCVLGHSSTFHYDDINHQVTRGTKHLPATSLEISLCSLCVLGIFVVSPLYEVAPSFSS